MDIKMIISRQIPRFLFLLVFFIGLNSLFSQTFSNKRKKIIDLTDTITIDTLSIIPSTFEMLLNGEVIPQKYYSLNWASAKLKINIDEWIKDRLGEQPITLNYRVFSSSFSSKVFDKNKATLIYQNADREILVQSKNKYVPSKVLRQQDLFAMDGLTKAGSLTRGVSFGNTQDASVISSFNLQLSGMLNKDIEIRAAITDENIPVQPDGNTQQLQDFDKIFIQLSKGSTRVTGGDFILQKPNGYFMNMYKKAQGMSVQTGIPNALIFKDKISGVMKIGVSGGVARGKFRRQEWMGKEGNQGPYRLTGNEGEAFVIVLSGSESVYVDGIKVNRGQENEYVIDYNTAEITFTAKKIITKDSRIVIEFEYSDRNYQRWMIHANNEWDYKRFSYRMNFFTELDDKNTPLNTMLSDSQKVFLSGIGDQLQQAIAPSADSIGFNNQQVLYKKIDTLFNAQAYTIYVYSTHPDSAFYQVSFSNVGEGNGNYQVATSTANGRVYQWVAPNPDGTKNGQYEPVVKLITPKSYRLLTGGIGINAGKGWSFDVEGAISDDDLNAFSYIDDQDNLAYAFRLQANFSKTIKKREKDSSSVKSTLSYEQVDNWFKPIIRFRSVEFERDWNRTNANNPNENFQNTITGTDYIPSLSIEFKNTRWGNVMYNGGAYLKGFAYKAFRNNAVFNLKKDRWNISFFGSQTSSFDTLQTTTFLRQRINIEKSTSLISFQCKAETEYNVFRDANTDSLKRNSYMFNVAEFSISQGLKTPHQWKLFYLARLDHLADTLNQLRPAALAHQSGGSFELAPSDHHSLSILFAYRNLQVSDTFLLKSGNENTILSRIEYNGKYFSDAITLDLFYEAGAGLENKRDFQFIQSMSGLGSHVWIDYNGDGIRQRDEYEIRTGTIVGDDGLTYIKFFVPTSEFIRTYYNQFTAALNIQTPKSWKKEKGWRKIASHFSSQTAFRSDRKTQSSSFIESLQPFDPNTNDTSLISLNYSFRQTIFVNRFGTRFGLEINYQDNQNKILLAHGVDTRKNKFINSRMRWNITSKVNINTELKAGQKAFESPLLRTRNYLFDYYEAKPEMVIQPSTKFRLGLGYRIGYKNNQGIAGDSLLPGGEQTWLHDASAEIKTNFIAKGQLMIRTNVFWITYNAQSNTPLAFEMLESLKPGLNLTWGVSFQRTIGNYLQLSLQYDGRKSENSPFVHIASMQLRAFF
jgi:hypothetical protein